MTKQIEKRAALGAGFAAILLAITACGSSDDTPTSAEDVSGPAESVSTSAAAPTPTSTPTATPTATATASDQPTSEEPLDVSDAGVGAMPFGTGVDEVTAKLTDRFGEPEVSVGPTHYSRIDGQDGWYEVAGDPISPSWRHEFVSVSCWGGFCTIFGGDRADDLQLRGWELMETNREFSGTTRWDASPHRADPAQHDVRLAGSGITVGSSWEELHAAYPRTVAQAAEGASLAVGKTPWPGIFDGAGEWRLSGHWDYDHPAMSADGEVVIRLSAGEGPEPGCC